MGFKGKGMIKARQKYGKTLNRIGHGGARGNGAHLSSNAKPTSEANRREESRIKNELRREGQE